MEFQKKVKGHLAKAEGQKEQDQAAATADAADHAINNNENHYEDGIGAHDWDDIEDGDEDDEEEGFPTPFSIVGADPDRAGPIWATARNATR